MVRCSGHTRTNEILHAWLDIWSFACLILTYFELYKGAIPERDLY